LLLLRNLRLAHAETLAQRFGFVAQDRSLFAKTCVQGDELFHTIFDGFKSLKSLDPDVHAGIRFRAPLPALENRWESKPPR